MGCITEKFIELKHNREKALVGFVVCGDPDIGISREICLHLCKAGVDVLELGVPFSDPTADGPVIQRASQRALKSGTTLNSVFDVASQLKKEVNTPIVLFSYYNPIFKLGVSDFYRRLIDTGIDGVLVVDLPPEESQELTGCWQNGEVDFIRLIAPTTPESRIEKITSDASGFIYLISKTGVTGSEGLDYGEISGMIRKIRKFSDLPVCVGFGISTPEQVKNISAISDGVVIGSAFVKTIELNLENRNVLLEMLLLQVKSYKDAQNL